jgi:cell division protein FtsB
VDSRLNETTKGPQLSRALYVLVVVGIVALALDGVFGPHGLIVTYRMKLQARQAQQNIQKLNEQNQQLANQVRSLKSDPTAIEHIAREKMGLVKPGDLVFKLPPKPPNPANSAAPQQAPPHP